MLVKTAIRPCELGVWLTRNICLYWQNNLKQQTKAVKEPPRRFPLSPSKSIYMRDPLCRIGHSALFLKSSLASVGNGTTWLFQRSFVTFRQVLLRTNRSRVPNRRPYAGQASLHTDRYFFLFFFLVLMWFSSIIWLVPIPLDVYRRDSNSFKAFPGRNRVVELKVAAEF